MLAGCRVEDGRGRGHKLLCLLHLGRGEVPSSGGRFGGYSDLVSRILLHSDHYVRLARLCYANGRTRKIYGPHLVSRNENFFFTSLESALFGQAPVRGGLFELDDVSRHFQRSPTAFVRHDVRVANLHHEAVRSGNLSSSFREENLDNFSFFLATTTTTGIESSIKTPPETGAQLLFLARM